jgi:MFS transporter, DHA2 family, multidrug resistance protein
MTATRADAGDGRISSISPRQWLVLGAIQLSTLLFGMAITLVNVVLPQIRGTLSATQEEIAWVVTANLVAIAVGTPVTGWLAQRLGWRNLLFGAVSGFSVCSLGCGLAGSLESLVLWRIGQGLFGAPIQPIAQAVLLATFSRALQPLVMMLWGLGSVFGPVLGPILGSMVAEAYGWRMAFFMLVPPGLAAMAFIWFALREHTQRGSTALDWTGFIALSLVMSSAQLIMDRGQRLDWFDSIEIRIELLVLVLSLWVFIVHSMTAKKPMLDPSLLRDRNFACGLVICLVMGMLSFTTLVLFPSLLHDLKGYPDSLVGLVLTARGVGNWCSFLIVVPFTKYRPRLAIVTGLASQAIAGIWMAQLDLNMTPMDVFLSNMLQGFGFGLAFTPMAVLAFATLPTVRAAEGTAVFNALRNFGSSVFISATVVVLVRSTAANYAMLTENVSPYNRALAFPGVLGLWNVETASGLAVVATEVQRQAAMSGYINAFYMFAACAAAGIPLALLMRQPGRT